MSSSDENTSGSLSPQGWQIEEFQVSGSTTNLLMLTWAAGTLQYSDDLPAVSWTNMVATSPYVVDVNAARKRFFRIAP